MTQSRDGSCCPIEKIDDCGLCNGNSIVDSMGNCCDGVLDSGGNCCQGTVDDCGVCKGDGTFCGLATSLIFVGAAGSFNALNTNATLRENVAEIMSGRVSSYLGTENINITFSSTDERVETTVWIEPPVPLELVESENTLLSRLLPLMEVPVPVGEASFRLSSVGPIRREGHCGNDVCEVDEPQNGCDQDCPLTAVNLCEENETSCSGHGTCAAFTGDCVCYAGYTGAACNDCGPDFERLLTGFCGRDYNSISSDPLPSTQETGETNAVIDEPEDGSTVGSSKPYKANSIAVIGGALGGVTFVGGVVLWKGVLKVLWKGSQVLPRVI
ncbi:hypothetical protein BSKO_03717 [Bryopsis sp. KO-2023]|nr:hypothetical protein BSKO_03717 [Bryopsis sp. KO-2023]